MIDFSEKLEEFYAIMEKLQENRLRLSEEFERLTWLMRESNLAC